MRRFSRFLFGVLALTVVGFGLTPGVANATPCEGAGGAKSAHANAKSVTVYCNDGSSENYRFAPIEG